MGNSAPNVFFGDGVPDHLQDNESFVGEQKSLQEVEAAMGGDKEKELLAQLLAQVEPEALDENQPLCEFVALASLRFRRHDMESALGRVTKYIAWRREMFGSLAAQDIDAVGDTKYPGKDTEQAETAKNGGGKEEEGEEEEGEEKADQAEAATGGRASVKMDSEKLNTTRDLLQLGVISVLPQSTPQGQRILYLRLARSKPHLFKHYARHVVRATHFVMMSLLRQSPRCQARGIVAMTDFSGTSLSNVDRKVPPKMGKLLSGILPVRIAGILVCKPNMIVRVVVPLAKMFMSEKIAGRLHIVSELDDLQQVYGLPKAALPSGLGGDAESVTPVDPETYVH